MSTDACPPTSRLRQVALGKAPEDQVIEIATHVEGCPDCLRDLEELDHLGDPLINIIRHHARTTLPAITPGTQALMLLAEVIGPRIWCEMSLASQDASVGELH